MTPNEIVHKAMGLCWHGTFLPKRLYGAALYCEHCGVYIDHCELNPDYSQPEHIGKVYAWMRITGKWIPFQDFLRVRLFRAGARTIQALAEFHNKDENQQIELIAEWITEGIES